ncbi:MAG: TPM domain-containing protein [Catonella sp.]|uniref:TPM domain-containing protein n=1 Tax=Catonella sp. TaxID=2382125 RepID=UPI003F9EC404
MKKNTVCKKISFLLMTFMLMLSFAGSFSFSVDKVYSGEKSLRLIDNADVLTDEEEASLSEKLDEISERQKVDVVILTVQNETDKNNIKMYAADYYDYNGYGFGENADGIILAMDYGSRAWGIVTTGKGMNIFTDAGQEYMTDKFIHYISDGDTYKGFETYADLCDKFIEQYVTTGEAYDVDHLPKDRNMLFVIGGAVIPALILAAIVCSVLTSQLKTVIEQHKADNYAVKESFYVRDAMDLFLYKNVTKSKIEKSSSSSGGSSSFTGSSGRSHGGSSGSF